MMQPTRQERRPMTGANASRGGSKDERDPGMIERIARAVGQVIEDLRRRWALRRELAGSAAADEIAAVLRDIGLTPADVGAVLAGHPQSAWLLDSMAERQGVDLNRLHYRFVLRDMQRTCALCEERARCRRWLQSPRGGDHHRFCPNAELIDWLHGSSWLLTRGSARRCIEQGDTDGPPASVVSVDRGWF
jgi:hypothetical protein